MFALPTQQSGTLMKQSSLRSLGFIISTILTAKIAVCAAKPPADLLPPSRRTASQSPYAQFIPRMPAAAASSASSMDCPQVDIKSQADVKAAAALSRAEKQLLTDYWIEPPEEMIRPNFNDPDQMFLFGLIVAARKGNSAFVRRLLSQPKVDVNS